jgi:hypothetical protein
MAKRFMIAAVASASLLALAGCSQGGTGQNSGGGSSTTSSTSSTSSGGQSGTALNIEPCFSQEVAPGITVQDLLTRDTLRLDLSRPAGFPNGRRLQDPVIDLTLAYFFLDLRVHRIDDIAKLAVNPAANADVIGPGGAPLSFLTSFPYVLPAHGAAKSEGTGSNFNFRTNPASDFEVIDAMGNPAVATVLVSANVQPGFNNNTPADYVSGGGKYLSNFKQTLGGLATLLKDDFEKLQFTTCAKTT